MSTGIAISLYVGHILCIENMLDSGKLDSFMNANYDKNGLCPLIAS